MESAAHDKLERGDIEGALELYTKLAVEDMPAAVDDNWELLISLSEMNEKYADVGSRAAELAVTMHPNSWSSWEKLLEDYERRDEVYAAVDRLKSTVDENHFASLRALGTAYTQIGDYVKASKALETGIEVCPNEAWAYAERLSHLRETQFQDYDGAIRACKMALSAGTPFPQFMYLALGNLYRKQGRIEDAMDAYEKYIDVDLDFDILFTVTEAYLQDGEVNRAIHLMEKSIAKIPSELALRKRLAQLYSHSGDYEAAIKIYQTALDEMFWGDGESEVWELMGHAKQIVGDLEGAIHAMEMAVDINPGISGYWQFLENLYDMIGDDLGVKETRHRGQKRLKDQ